MLFGKFCLLERVSVGGMAEVFRAKPLNPPDPNRYFALKRILPHLAEDDEFIKMFVDEARLTVKLRHPNVVQNYELGQFQASHYILMEFIAGKDILALQKHVRNEQTIVDVDMGCYIAHEIARGLHYVHRKTDEHGVSLGIIHRDISPQNVLISWDGKVKVIDFGIAKAASQSTHTKAGVLKGKYGYMSPEQVRAKDIDHRSDIFALGTVFWELLTNRRLFKAQNQYQVLALIGEPEIEVPSTINPKVPPEVERIVMKALAPEREDRYQWAGEMAEDLLNYLKEQRPPFHRSQLTTWMRSAFREDYEEEKEKRKRFRDINTAADVRRLFDGAYGPGGPDGDEEVDEATQIWDVEILPGAGQDLDSYVADHTVVQAGGLDLSDYEEWANAPDTVDETMESLDARFDPSVGTDSADMVRAFEAEPTDVTVDHRRPEGLPVGVPQSTGVEEAPTPPEGLLRQRDLGTGVELSPVAGGATTRRVDPVRLVSAVLGVVVVVLIFSGALLVALNTDGASEAVPRGGILVEASPPTGLDIRLNGELIGHDAPLPLKGLRTGHYRIEVEHPDYPSWREEVLVEDGEVFHVVADLGAPGVLSLHWLERPENLKLYVNGEEQSTEEQSLSLEWPRGEVYLEAIGEGIRPYRRVVRVEAGEEKEVDLRFSPMLRLAFSGASDLSVTINGQSYGELPVAVRDLSPQRLYEIQIGEAETTLGYPEMGLEAMDMDRFEEIQGRTEEDYGWLTVQTGEDWWHLFIDDIDAGLTVPLGEGEKIPVLAGDRRVGLQRGAQRKEFVVRIFAGETTNLRRELALD